MMSKKFDPAYKLEVCKVVDSGTATVVVFGIDRTQSITAPQPTAPPTYEPWMSLWRPLSELPADYTTEQAITDGVYVNIHGSEIYNQQ